MEYSTVINSRGELLFVYVSQNGIDICNKGNSSTFVNDKVFDVTLCRLKLSDSINNWQVFDDVGFVAVTKCGFNYRLGQRKIFVNEKGVTCCSLPNFSDCSVCAAFC